jgi:TolB-like protein/Flp pilus assembly protein TadD
MALASPLAEAIHDRFLLERELGRGGMATVYLARDLKHDRLVALKVLRPDLAPVLGPDRFLQEIRYTARLQHPHILPVFDSGKAEGQLWYTMPYVEGESLRERLLREGQLPVSEAVRIAREVAEALDHSHRHGVIHRDVKPENILLEEGHAVVADFGIARALTRTTGAMPATTDAGIVLGSPAYMSPEQAMGEMTVDGRTDIYALGCVVYEMLAGVPPLMGPTAEAVFFRRRRERAPPLSLLRQTVSPELDAVVATALARLPADRFSTAAEFARALESVGAAVTPGPVGATLATRGSSGFGGAPETARPRSVRTPFVAALLGLGFLIGLGALFGWLQGHAGAGMSGSKRMAVLPFDNLGDSADAYFADGVTDAVRGKLAGVPGLQVIASASADDYRRTSKPPRLIAQELGVTYLLIGKIRWQKGQGRVNRVEVSPELIDLTNPGAPTTRWQQPFDARLTDVFQVQADIAGRVTEALDVALGKSQRETLDEPPTRNVAAYDAYLRGEELLKSGVEVETLRRAVAAYETAVALDSTFVAAWAQLSRMHSFLYGNAQITAAEAAQARTAAERALALAPNRFEGHLALGDYYSYIPGDNARALEQYALAQLTAPNNAQVLSAAALSEEGLGLWDAAVAHFRRALALDPRATRTAYGLARALLWLRRYPEALRAQDRALALTPASVAGLEDRAMIYLAQGDLAGARTVLRTAPGEVEPAALVAYVSQTCDLYWVLDEGQQLLLLRLTPAAFDDNRGTWGLALAATHALRADQPRSRAYADSARIALQEQLRATPTDAQLHALLGTALAYLGRRDEAVGEGERAVAMLPVSKDAFVGAYLQHQLARIYLLVGEPERAVDRLEPLLEIPYYLSPGWLRIDPTFAPLQGNPRFERLVRGS